MGPGGYCPALHDSKPGYNKQVLILKSKPNISSRFLTFDDIRALLALEQLKWLPEQVASAEILRLRIEYYPQLSFGAFNRTTGQLLVSVFCKPLDDYKLIEPENWSKYSRIGSNNKSNPTQGSSHTAFGISFTSINHSAAKRLSIFILLCLIRDGYRDIVLGSPVPGFRTFMEKYPNQSIENYVYAKTSSGSPRDRQLRYYYNLGFREIISIRADYFPHEDSKNYGVLLKREIPYQNLKHLLKILPIECIRTLSQLSLRIFTKL